MTEFPIVEETRAVKGIHLTFDKIRTRWDDSQGKVVQVNDGQFQVFVELELLYELSSVDYWDSDFGRPFLIDNHNVALALEQHDLAHRRGRGSYVPTDKLKDWLRGLSDASK